jgi:hypothetical protein
MKWGALRGWLGMDGDRSSTRAGYGKAVAEGSADRNVRAPFLRSVSAGMMIIDDLFRIFRGVSVNGAVFDDRQRAREPVHDERMVIFPCGSGKF